MLEARYRLSELSGLTGVEARTIRHYISIGLLPPPLSKGRDAHYGPVHLERLKAIAVLRRRMKLDEIREVLSCIDKAGLAELAEEWTLEKPESAKAYLDSIEGQFLGASRRRAPVQRMDDYGKPVRMQQHQLDDMVMELSIMPGDHDSGAAPIDRLIQLLQEGQPGTRVGSRRGQPWHVIKILPGIELHVRDQTETQLSRLERVCDHIRHILTGGHDA